MRKLSPKEIYLRAVNEELWKDGPQIQLQHQIFIQIHPY